MFTLDDFGSPRRASTYPRNLTTQQRSNAAAQRVRSEQPKVNDLDWTQTSSHTSARGGRSSYGLTSVFGLLLLPGYHFCTVGQLKG